MYFYDYLSDLGVQETTSTGFKHELSQNIMHVFYLLTIFFNVMLHMLSSWPNMWQNETFTKTLPVTMWPQCQHWNDILTFPLSFRGQAKNGLPWSLKVTKWLQLMCHWQWVNLALFISVQDFKTIQLHVLWL